MLDIKGFKVTQLIKEDTAKKIADDLASIPEELFCSRFHGMKTLGAASYLDIKNERSTKYYSSSGKDIEYYLEKQVNSLQSTINCQMLNRLK